MTYAENTSCVRLTTTPNYTKLYPMTDKEKTINLNENYHTALATHKKETGANMRFVVHLALQLYFERYAPDLVAVLKGDEPDESKALEPFKNLE